MGVLEGGEGGGEGGGIGCGKGGGETLYDAEHEGGKLLGGVGTVR